MRGGSTSDLEMKGDRAGTLITYTPGDLSIFGWDKLPSSTMRWHRSIADKVRATVLWRGSGVCGGGSPKVVGADRVGRQSRSWGQWYQHRDKIARQMIRSTDSLPKATLQGYP